MQRRPHLYRTLLNEVERNWSESELDEEFGILAGEEIDRGSDLGVEMDVEEGLVMEGRAMEDIVAVQGEHSVYIRERPAISGGSVN